MVQVSDKNDLEVKMQHPSSYQDALSQSPAIAIDFS